MNRLAMLYRDQERYGEAARTSRRAAVVAAATMGPDHRFRGIFLVTLGQSLRGLERYAEAERELREAYRIFAAETGPEGRWARAAAGHLAELYEASGRPEEAGFWKALVERPAAGSG